MKHLFVCLLLLLSAIPAAAQDEPEPLIEVNCNETNAADYSRFLRQAADALDSTIANGTDPDIAIANTEGVLSIALNLLASCDSLYFSSTAYRAEPGEVVEIGPVRLRRGAYRVLAVSDEADVSFGFAGDTCGIDERVTLSADDIDLGLYAIVVLDEACEATISMSSEAGEYGLFFNYIPRQPLIIDN